jgi:anthranilate phosphoribosyltransferase
MDTSLLNESLFEKLISGELSEEKTMAVLTRLSEPSLPLAVYTSLLMLLQETSPALEGLGEVLDCCGTGGSGLPHYNISTASAFVIASGGIRVAKFGNKAASSNSGSFDFLETMGLGASINGLQATAILEASGLVFLYARQYYPQLSQLAPFRKKLGRKTIFNTLGPLLNPAFPCFRLLGVSRPDEHIILASLLSKRSELQKAWVVSGPKQLDELSITGENHITEITPEQSSGTTYLRPSLASSENTVAGLDSSHDNVSRFLEALEPDAENTDYLQTVCLNSGAGFYIANAVDSLENGVTLAHELLRSGRVKEQLEKTRRAYERYTR